MTHDEKSQVKWKRNMVKKVILGWAIKDAVRRLQKSSRPRV